MKIDFDPHVNNNKVPKSNHTQEKSGLEILKKKPIIT